MHLRWMAAALLMLLSACANLSPMALDKATQPVDVSAKSIVLITLDVSRSDDSRYELGPMSMFWVRQDTIQEATTGFRISERDRVSAAGEPARYALRMDVEPGRYRLSSIFGMASAFPFHGYFRVPLLLDLLVPPRSVVYAGRIEATLRPRRDGEFRAGAVIPLIDQAVTGMSGGTFDVTVEDSSTADEAMFRAAFPALGDTPIVTTLLPPFDRARAQREFDGIADDAPVADRATTLPSRPGEPPSGR